MNNTERSGKAFIIPIVCAVICVAIVAAAIALALSDGEKADNGTAEAPSQSVTETEASDTGTKTDDSEPIENAVQQNDNCADDIFAP